MNILVSRCLLGFPCRYDGKSFEVEHLTSFIKKFENKHNFIAICPEIEGGLSVPRDPCEIVDGKVLTEKGADKTPEFEKGAKMALKKALDQNVQIAILKSKSPSCGTGIIYDGTFSNILTEGNGITSELLSKVGVYVITEQDLEKIEYLLSAED